MNVRLDHVTIQRVTLACPGFKGESVTIVGPYRAPGAQPGEFVVRRDDGTTLAVRPRDVVGPIYLATCGECGRSWNDAMPTSITPVPSGRCPFEHEHKEDNPHPTSSIPVAEVAAVVKCGSAADQCEALYELLGRYGVDVA